MNNAPLRLAALAAAVAVLACPAAARSDAAFAAALGKPLPGLATMAELKTLPQVPPVPVQAQGPVASTAAWRSVLQVAIREGKVEIDPKSKIHTFTVEDSFDHPNGNFYKLNIILLATKNADGSFKAHAAQLYILEIQAAVGGAVRAEHWFFNVSGAGRLREVRLISSVTRGNSTVRGPEEVKDLAAPEVKERFDETVDYWHWTMQR
ncbi:MAG: hypothetical protein Q8T11_04040 [Elusimicrobiota bacterium]|nr:hypothetical protein [Elusimicrobiota bacterium]